MPSKRLEEEVIDPRKRNAEACGMKDVTFRKHSGKVEDIVLELKECKSLSCARQLQKRISSISSTRKLFFYNVLLSWYTGHGNIKEAKVLFDTMPSRNMVTWNAMVAGLINHGVEFEGRAVQRMQPCFNDVSYNLSFQIEVASAQNVKAAFDALPVRRIATWTNLMKAYAGQELKKEAAAAYEKMPMHDVLCGSVRIGCSSTDDEAKSEFDSMKEHNLCSWTSLLTVYAVAGSPNNMMGVLTRMPQHSIVTRTSALFGYVRAGYTDEAASFFWQMPERGIMAWIAVLAGYAHDGRRAEGVDLFRLMVLEGEEPDSICFSRMFGVCSHVGKVEEGRQYFLDMKGDYGLDAGLEHYNAMVDMLARAGHLDAAEELVAFMPFRANTPTLQALAAACRSRKDEKRLARVLSLALDMGVANASSYVMLSNASRERCEHGAKKAEADKEQAAVMKPRGSNLRTFSVEAHYLNSHNTHAGMA